MAGAIPLPDDELERENPELWAKLAETERKLADAQEVIHAIQAGEVDAVVVSGPRGEQVFTLQGAEYTYRTLVEAMNEGAATVGADGTVLYCNHRLAELMDIPLERIIGNPAINLVADADKSRLNDLIARALGGQAATAELELCNPTSGRCVPVYLSLRAMQAEELNALCLVAADLTERKRADAELTKYRQQLEELVRERTNQLAAANEQLQADMAVRRQAQEALLESQERLSLVLEGADLGIWDWNIVTDTLLWSPHCCRLFGLDPDLPMSHQRFLEAVHPEDRERVDRAVLSAVQKRDGYEVEMRALWPDGSVHWMMSRGRAYFDASGRPIRMSGVAQDITQRKRAEEALIRSEKLASVGRMAASIAHEINNPLEAVTNTIFLAQHTEQLPDQARKYLEMADAELRRIAHITRQSLGFYRESNAPEPTSIPAVLDAAMDLLKSRIRSKQAVIKRDWEGDLCLTAVGGELRQVFANLLVNSLDAIEEKGNITVRAAHASGQFPEQRCVRITVADNGRGIPRALRPQIFEPFFTTKSATGSGLGLWVTRQIVEKHHGRIRLRTATEGRRRGTVVSVVLPVTTEAPSTKLQAPGQNR